VYLVKIIYANVIRN